MSPPSPRAELAALTLGDRAAAWRSLGFSATEDGMALGRVWIHLGASGRGIVGWSLRGVAQPAVDGLPGGLPPASGEPGGEPSAPHPNGALGIDHLVMLTPDFDRTAASLGEAGLPLRRIRQAPGGVRQGFRRLGEVILELVEAPTLEPGPARFWGLVVIVEDLPALAARLGELLGPIKEAVQPGRQIATLRSSAGLQEAVAFMDPES